MQKFTINKQKNVFEFEDGSTAPINAQDIDEARGNVSGKNPKGLAIKESTKQKLREEKKRAGHGIGALDSINTAFDQGQSSIVSAPADYLSAIYDAYKNEDKSERSFLNRVEENYEPRRQARREYKQELLAKEPIASYIGKGVGIAGEIGATAGLGVAAAPVLGFANSSTSLFNPSKVALEAVTDTALGLGIDKLVGLAGKVAGSRGIRQAEKAGIAKVEADNALKQQATNKLNTQESTRFAQETAARDAQMAAIPGQQSAAQQAFSQNVTQNVSKIGDTLGKAKVAEEVLGLDNFILNNVDRSALAGTPEANKFVKFVKTVFNSNGNGVDKAHLNQAFQAIEGRIAVAEGAEKDLLLKLKDEMTQTLSQVIPEAAIYHQFGEPIAKEVARDAGEFVKKLVSKTDPDTVSQISKSIGSDFGKTLEDSIKNDIQTVFQKYSGNFSEAAQNGNISSEISQLLQKNPIINGLINDPAKFVDKRLAKQIKQISSNIDINQSDVISKFNLLRRNLEHFPQTIGKEIEASLMKNGNKIAREKIFQTQEINKLLPNIQGAAQAIPEPSSVRPAINAQPNLQQVPDLSQAQGPTQTFANFLEDSTLMQKLKSLKGSFGGAGGASAAGAMAKMAGIPIGKTLGLAGATLTGLEVLTKNSAVGQQARSALKQGLLQSYLVTKAKFFPSFRDGILDDPNDRRMFTREIEDDPTLSLEDKAMYQTKINRGQPF